MTPAPRPTLTATADFLTALRAGLAIPIAIVTWAALWDVAGLLLSIAWLTDFFDGRLARSGGGGRLGRFDLPADTAVAAGAVVGLYGGGHLAAWIAVPATALGLAYVIGHNPSFSMLFQAVAYGGVLWWLTRPIGWGFGVAGVTVVVIAMLGWDRLFARVLPTFFSGLRLRRVLSRFSLDRD